MELLLQDTRSAQAFVSNHMKGNLTQSQFDALVRVAFNSPRAALKLADQFSRSPKIGPEDFINTLPHGAASPRGLINRRTEEANLYLRGEYGRQQE